MGDRPGSILLRENCDAPISSRNKFARNHKSRRRPQNRWRLAIQFFAPPAAQGAAGVPRAHPQISQPKAACYSATPTALCTLTGLLRNAAIAAARAFRGLRDLRREGTPRDARAAERRARRARCTMRDVAASHSRCSQQPEQAAAHAVPAGRRLGDRRRAAGRGSRLTSARDGRKAPGGAARTSSSSLRYWGYKFEALCTAEAERRLARSPPSAPPPRTCRVILVRRRRLSRLRALLLLVPRAASVVDVAGVWWRGGCVAAKAAAVACRALSIFTAAPPAEPRAAGSMCSSSSSVRLPCGVDPQLPAKS